jgi:hypothetical protein
LKIQTLQSNFFAALLVVWVVSFLRRPAFGSATITLRTCLDIRVNAKPFGFETSHSEQKIHERDELESEFTGMKHTRVKQLTRKQQLEKTYQFERPASSQHLLFDCVQSVGGDRFDV